MSWLFSRALVEEFSEARSLDGEPSAQLNVMPTEHKFSRFGKTIEASDLSRFGLTCEVLTGDRGEELLMSFLAASHARTSASRAKATDSTERAADYGARWPALFAKFNPLTSSWKTAQFSLLEDSGGFLETWPRWGSMRNGESFLRQTWAPGISASASGLWPTPVAERAHARSRMRKGGTPLSLAVKLYPTPTAMTNSGGAALCKWGGSRSREKLRTMVSPEELNGPLNPEWVEWLMGWPRGWTDLQPLAMDKYREWQQQHSLS